MNYAEGDSTTTTAKDDQAYTVDGERHALADKDANRFPVFKVKDKDTTFKQRFTIPLVNKALADSSRPAPTLGIRRGAVFVVKPLHDPSGEFAIVLYDPTIDDDHVDEEKKRKEDKQQQQQQQQAGGEDKKKPPTLDGPLVHKSLSDILGLKKQVDTRPRVPVVIDPKLAKVLRPHQVEGVKVRRHPLGAIWLRYNADVYCPTSSSTGARLEWLSRMQTAASWQMRWGWAKLYDDLTTRHGTNPRD